MSLQDKTHRALEIITMSTQSKTYDGLGAEGGLREDEEAPTLTPYGELTRSTEELNKYVKPSWERFELERPSNLHY